MLPSILFGLDMRAGQVGVVYGSASARNPFLLRRRKRQPEPIAPAVIEPAKPPEPKPAPQPDICPVCDTDTHLYNRLKNELGFDDEDGGKKCRVCGSNVRLYNQVRQALGLVKESRIDRIVRKRAKRAARRKVANAVQPFVPDFVRILADEPEQIVEAKRKVVIDDEEVFRLFLRMTDDL